MRFHHNHHLCIILTIFLVSITSSVVAQSPTEKAIGDKKTSLVNDIQTATVPLPPASYVPDPVVTKRTPETLLPANPPPTGEDAWRMEITPYLWAPQLEGNLRIRNTTVRVDASASSLISMLDFAAAVHFEAYKRKFGVFVDENYVNLGTEGVRPNGNVTEIEPTINIFEAGAMYAPLIIQNKKATATEPLPPVFSLEFLGGVRVFYLGLGIDPTNIAPLEESRTIVDVFGGNRLSYRPIPPLTISGKYTLGGGGSHFAWTAELMGDFRFRRNMSLNAGYRMLDMNADQESNTVGFDGRMRGLLFGFTFYR